MIAGAWLIPLTAAFLLQPQGRAAPGEADTRRRLLEGTVTTQALDREMSVQHACGL